MTEFKVTVKHTYTCEFVITADTKEDAETIASEQMYDHLLYSAERAEETFETHNIESE